METSQCMVIGKNKKEEDIIMKLLPTYVYKKDGSRIINSYRIALAKTECGKIGLKAGDELKAEFRDKEIILKKK